MQQSFFEDETPPYVPIVPRDYQRSAIESAANFIKYRSGHGYIKAPGGSGKSVMIAKVAEYCHDLGMRVIILARNEKLLRQNKAKLAPQYQEVTGIYCAGIGEKDLSKPITIASVQSIAGADTGFFNIAIVDECDEIPYNSDGDSQYWQFFRQAGNPRIIGFTATDFRTLGGLISWGEKIIDVPIAPLMEKGYLVPPVCKAAGNPDMAQVEVGSTGDYVISQAENVYLEPELLLVTVGKILAYAEHRNHVLVFCMSLRHADVLAKTLEDNGQSVMTVTGDTDKEELGEILQDFEAGAFKYLINCDLLKVGIDLPCIDMVAIIRATKSKRMFEQMVYRGTRPCEGKKDFTLLDMGNNLVEHGALGSPYRQKPKGERAAPKGKICPECEEVVFPANAQHCTCCGYVFPVKEESKVSHSWEESRSTYPVYAGDKATYDVFDVAYKEHINKKKGTRSIRVEYFCDYGKYGTICEWLAAWSTSDWARGKAEQFFEKRGYKLGAPIETYKVDDLLHHTQWLKKPAQIVVDHSEEFPRIIEYIWEKPQGDTTESLAIQSLADELDDEIMF